MSEFNPFLSALTKEKFKGEIWENASRFKLVGKGYASMPAEQDGHFQIETANHMRGPLRALNDPDVRKVYLAKATQTFGSICGDITVPFWLEHESDSVLCVFEDDPKAKLYVATRLMDTVKQHPEISKMISGIMEEDTQGRHRITSTRIKFTAGRLLEIGGANDGTMSSLSWRFIWGSEAWLWKPGMLEKLERRADRFANNCKIFIESQAGMAGEDFDTKSKLAHRVPLTWACPYCGGRQTWECPKEYSIPRPGDFKPIRPRQGAGAQLEIWTPPVPGSESGMKIPPADAGNGKILTLEERARLAKWECYHCGTLIEDNLKNRKAIADSYDQDYRIPILDADNQPTGRFRTPKTVLFVVPREGNYTNSFESGAASYLEAKEAFESGNPVKLENWYMSQRAIFYEAKLTQTRVEVITSTVDLDEKGRIPNEAFRSLNVDCQKDLVESLKQGKDVTGHFWYTVCGNDKQGNTVELQWGYATSWEMLFGVVTTNEKGERIITGGIKNKFKIPTRNVAIDGGNWLDIVKEKAAHYRTMEPALDDSGKMVWATWKVMVGDDGRGVKWEDGVWRSYWPPKTYVVDILDRRPGGDRWLKINVQVHRWSNLAAKQILYKMRLGLPGQPKITHTAAVDDITRAKAIGQKSYEDQMNGFAIQNDPKTKKTQVVEFHHEQHLVDCHCENIVLKMMHGTVRGEALAAPATGQEADK